MGVDVTSAVLASIVSVTVAIAILIRRPRRPLYQYFSAFTGSLFLWNVASVAARFSGSDLHHVQVTSSLLIPPTASLFFRELLRERSRAAMQLNRLALALSGLLFVVGLSPLGAELLYGVIGTSYSFTALALMLHGLYRRTRTARGDERKRLGLLFYGGVVTLGLTTAELLPAGSVAVGLGHVALTFYVYFLYQSILARRLVDLVELLGKAAVLAVLTLVLATVYALLVLWVGTHQQGLWLFNTLVASFVILILYDQVRTFVEESTAKVLFRERYELRQLLRRLLRSLRTTTDLAGMRTLVLDTLHASGRASQLSIYLQVEGDAAYVLYGHRGQKPPETLSMGQHPTLLAELRRDKKPILVENLVMRQQELPTFFTADDASLQRELERTEEAIAVMRQIGASAVIPMVIDDRTLGLMCLGAERAAEAYSTDELALFLSVAEACAVIIENSQEYESRRERDRLVAIGEMAAGMAHEIRNPLGAIKGAVQCLDPSGMPKEEREFVDVILEEVDRLNRVVSAFLEYARPYRGNPIVVDVNGVVTATLKLMARDIPAGVTIEQRLADDLPPVLIDPEQLKQVLLNLVRNALQAMPKGGIVTVSTMISFSRAAAYNDDGAPRFTDTPQVLVRVRDTGEGIKSDDLPRIFVPFFTTKGSGTGLGLAISQRIVENAGGRLEASSRAGEGASFSIRLPAGPPTVRERPAADEPTVGEAGSDDPETDLANLGGRDDDANDPLGRKTAGGR